MHTTLPLEKRVSATMVLAFLFGCFLLPSLSYAQGLGSFQSIIEDIDKENYVTAAKQLTLRSAQDTRLAQSSAFLFTQAYLKRKQEAYAQAETYLDQSFGLAQQEHPRNDTLLSKIHYEYALISWEKEAFQEAFQHVHTCINFQKNFLSPKSVELGRCYDFLGLLQSGASNYAEAVLSFREAINIFRQDSSMVVKRKLGKSIRKLGNCHYRMGEFNKALKLYQESLDIWDMLGNSAGERANCYTLIGNVYDEWRDFGQAFDFHQLSVSISRKLNDKAQLASCLTNQGVTQMNTQQYAEALASFREALELMQATSSTSQKKMATIYLDMGSLYGKLGQRAQAILYFEKSLALRKKLWGGIHPEVSASHLSLGEFYLAQKAYEQAEIHLFKARDSCFKGVVLEHFRVADPYLALARLYVEMQQWDKAMHNAHATLIAVGNDFFDQQIEVNPEGKALQSPLQDKLLTALKLKGDLWLEKGKISQDTSHFTQALSCYQIAMGLVDSIRIGLQATSSRRYWQEAVFGLYESAMEASYQLYSSTKADQYAKKAFEFSEKYKATLLRIRLQALDIQTVLEVDKDELDKERKLREEVSFHEYGIFQAKKEKKLPSVEQETALAEAQVAYRDFISTFEQKYPTFRKLKYKNSQISITQIRQEIIPGSTMLVEYFAGDSAWYVMAFDQKSISLRKLLPIQVLASVDSFLYLCSPAGIHEESSKLLATGTELYLQLLAPELQSTSINKLIIIPDQELIGLAFEALKWVNDSRHIDPAETVWVGQKYTLHYGYSASLLVEDKKYSSHKKANRFLGIFAPSFELINSTDSSSNWHSLPHSAQEASLLAQLYDAETFAGKEASVDRFMSEAAQYKILHISTHAAARSDIPMSAFLVMADHLLPISSLFSLELHADLVVLSACETGKGFLQKGEGVMSLSRGFAYAGCPNSLISLWQVDDASTKQLMVHFYENLQAGMKRDEALQQAQANILAEGSVQQQHPAYWAGFQLWGTDTPLEKRENANWLWMVLLLCLLGGLVVLLNQKALKKS